ncbi:hypothetical protein DFR58_108113 [Anaerobacterium chartisolvens]|uniref:Uncharacterized protein n=1 Tax=Anaerobacterium chartisolvens TaxID=1297424 RepID=A0A369B6S9_9FIRM|nr:hypothetical protein [Anaerobacterium chartisolvens]RCX17219.1 hypothetical protein DFR58_108113 [Anaerobacterium chartisolvens]
MKKLDTSVFIYREVGTALLIEAFSASFSLCAEQAEPENCGKSRGVPISCSKYFLVLISLYFKT